MRQLNSYYQATSKAKTWNVSYPALINDIETDVCVIGGGMAGLSAAQELHKRHYRVCVLEAESIGFGASGRNGGQAIIDVGCGYSKLKSLIGEEKATKIFLLTTEGINIIRQNVKDFNIDCDLIDGTLTVAQKKSQEDSLQEYQQLYHQMGYAVERWDKKKTQETINSPIYTGAIYDPLGLHLHPLNYCLGLAKVLNTKGIDIYEHTKAFHFKDDGSKVIVKTPNGKVTAKKLILCANVFNDINKYLMDRIMPVGTYIAATKPLGEEVAKRLVANRAAVCDMNFVLDYYRVISDTRLLFGGRVSYTGKAPFNLKKSLFQRMVRVYPEFSSYHPEEIFEYAWGGHVDITINRAPHFGNLSDHVYFLQGFSGHGVALTHIAGRVVAEAIDRQPERFDLFTGIPHNRFFGGKIFRTPLLALGMIYFRLKDYW